MNASDAGRAQFGQKSVQPQRCAASSSNWSARAEEDLTALEVAEQSRERAVSQGGIDAGRACEQLCRRPLAGPLWVFAIRCLWCGKDVLEAIKISPLRLSCA